ncbi:MAG: amidase [Janthinobacterium lividum]
MSPRPGRLLGALFFTALGGHVAMSAEPHYEIQGRTVTQIEADLAAGHITSERLVGLYVERIHAVDAAGPTLHSVLAINPDALAEARDSDLRRRTHAPRALEGIPVLIKDNIDVAGPLPTTAGSLALVENVTGRDAPLVRRLREAGAVILGKTNLSEWANMRGSRSISGWSGVGGLTRNPYSLDRSPCGSSSGSGVAVAASLAPIAIGTETDGSVTCPANVNGLVGLKPTVGLVSRTHIIPISSSQDTAGPMARTVTDVARLLTVIAGSDPDDAVTRAADAHRTDYMAALDAHALKGRRIGVMRFAAGYHPEVDTLFDQSLDRMRAAGATIVEIKDFPGLDTIAGFELTVMLTELKTGLNAYLATTPPSVRSRTLADLIAFNEAHRDRELGLFGQELFIKAEATQGLDDPAYRTARDTARRLAGPEGIDRLLAADHLDALVAPTGAPAWTVDAIDGDHDSGSASMLPAVAGLPHLTVPMGLISGLPVGISFIGAAWSEARLLALGYAFEQAHPVLPTPRYPHSIDSNRTIAALLVPAAVEPQPKM